MHSHPDSDASSLPTRDAREKLLARTYETFGDGWQRVLDYRRVREYQQQHPDDGYWTTAKALDLNPNRIRQWVKNDAKPDPVHAIETADANGWLDAEPGDRVFEALSLLVAWTYAGGNITADTYSLTLTVSDDDPEPLARELLEAVGFPVETVHADADGRATDYRPSGAGRSHLGRFLHGVLDAPVGAKTEQKLSIPAWLDAVPPATRTRWVQLYIGLRGTTADDQWIRLTEQREGAYLAELGALIRSVVDDEDVRVGQDTVFIRPQIAHLLQGLPRLPAA